MARPRKQYLAGLRRRTTPESRQRYREHFGPTGPRLQPTGPRQSREPALTDPRTAKQVRGEARAAGELQYGSAQRQKEAELYGAKVFGSQKLPTLYEQYRQEVAQAAQRTADAYATAQRQMAGSDANVQAQYQADQARRATEDQKVSQVTGGTLQAPPETGAARAASAGSFQGLLGTRAAEETSFYGQLGAAGTKRQIESESFEQQRQRGIQAELGDIKSRRGAAETEFFGKARDEERQYAAEAKAFGIKSQGELDKAEAARLANKRNRALARFKATNSEKYARQVDRLNRQLAKLKHGQSMERIDANKPSGGGGGKDSSGSTDFRYAVSKLRADMKKEGVSHQDLLGKNKAAGRNKRTRYAEELAGDFGLNRDTALKAVQYMAFVTNPRIEPKVKAFWKKKLGV